VPTHSEESVCGWRRHRIAPKLKGWKSLFARVQRPPQTKMESMDVNIIGCARRWAARHTPRENASVEIERAQFAELELPKPPKITMKRPKRTANALW
jgi:hypothetical protein